MQYCLSHQDHVAHDVGVFEGLTPVDFKQHSAANSTRHTRAVRKRSYSLSPDPQPKLLDDIGWNDRPCRTGVD